jgi:hypothetical protein
MYLGMALSEPSAAVLHFVIAATTSTLRSVSPAIFGSLAHFSVA